MQKIKSLCNNHLYTKRYVFRFYQDLLFFYTKDYKRNNLNENEYLDILYNEYSDLINFSLRNLYFFDYNQNEKIIKYIFELDFEFLLKEIFFRSRSNLDLFPKNLELIKDLIKNIFKELCSETLNNDGWLDKEDFIIILNKYKKEFNKLNKEIKDILKDSKYLGKRKKDPKNRNIEILKEKIKNIKEIKNV